MPSTDIGFNCYEVSKRIRQLRESQNLTQLQLAEKLNVSEQLIKNYEKAYLSNGQSTGRASDKTTAIAGMKIETLHKISQVFNVSTDYILGLSSIKSSESTIIDMVKSTGLTEQNILSLNAWNNLTNLYTQKDSTCTCQFVATLMEELGQIDDLVLLEKVHRTMINSIISALCNNAKELCAYYENILHATALAQQHSEELSQSLLVQDNQDIFCEIANRGYAIIDAQQIRDLYISKLCHALEQKLDTLPPVFYEA